MGGGVLVGVFKGCADSHDCVGGGEELVGGVLEYFYWFPKVLEVLTSSL